MTPDELYTKIINSKLIAFDCETTGLDWRQHFIAGYVLTFAPGDTHYFPIRHWTGNLEDAKRYEDVIRAAVSEAYHTTFIMHNAPFDLIFCAKHGIEFNGLIHDTGVMAPMVYEHEDSYSLDNLCKVYECENKKVVDIYQYLGDWFKESPHKQLMSRFWELPGNDPNVVSYACMDGEATYELYGKLNEEIDKQQLTECWNVEQQLTPVLHRITKRGMKIDQDQLVRIQQIAHSKLKEATENLPEDLNVRSPTQMEKLFRAHSITTWPITEKGRASFPASWLRKTDLGQNIIAVREWAHLLNTFINPMIEDHLYNGRVHTNYAQLRTDDNGTISGRLSSYNPNLQNMTSVERHPEQGKLLRSVFVPDDGQTLYESDYSQCEVRLAAHVGKIDRWIYGYNAHPPLDAHSIVANISGLPRNKAKVLNLAILLGAGRDKAIDMLGVDTETGEKILAIYHGTFPDVKRLQRRVAEKFLERGYLTSVLKRRYRLVERKFAYMGLSRILQGGNADVTKVALVEADKIKDIELMNTVHDSIIWQSEGDKGKKQVIEAMTDYVNEKFQLRAPLAVEVKSGTSWGNMQ